MANKKAEPKKEKASKKVEKPTKQAKPAKVKKEKEPKKDPKEKKVKNEVATINNQGELVETYPDVVIEKGEVEKVNQNIVEATVLEDQLTEYDHKRIDNDIKYRGPLSYRYLRLIGWIAMSLMFISMMLMASLKIKGIFVEVPESTKRTYEMIAEIISYISALPLPLFLIANFAIIFQSKGDYKNLLLRYGKLCLAIYVGFLIVYYHYIVILLMRLGEMSFFEARELSIDIFTLLGKQNGLVVNVFVDLFMCALMMFFIDYDPKKYFQGKWIILFRSLALLPLLYEVGSALIMGFMGANNMFWDFTFSLPPEILPLIGKKPVGMVVAFLIICIFVKIRKHHYLKKGGTPEGYNLYVQTNRNSFRFSLTMSIVFLIIVLVDIVTLIGLTVWISNGQPEEYVYYTIDLLTNFTVGKSICLILCIPFVMLFSYTKTHKNAKMDKLLPLIGIGLIAFSIIETLFFGLLF